MRTILIFATQKWIWFLNAQSVYAAHATQYTIYVYIRLECYVIFSMQSEVKHEVSTTNAFIIWKATSFDSITTILYIIYKMRRSDVCTSVFTLVFIVVVDTVVVDAVAACWWHGSTMAFRLLMESNWNWNLICARVTLTNGCEQVAKIYNQYVGRVCDVCMCFF